MRTTPPCCRLRASCSKTGERSYASRFQELAGKRDFGSLDEAFRSALMRDTLVMVFTYQKMVEVAIELMDRHSTEMLPDALQNYGPLGEVIQVRPCRPLAELLPYFFSFVSSSFFVSFFYFSTSPSSSVF